MQAVAAMACAQPHLAIVSGNRSGANILPLQTEAGMDAINTAKRDVVAPAAAQESVGVLSRPAFNRGPLDLVGSLVKAPGGKPFPLSGRASWGCSAV
jgi:hypothetical protein